jgi:hypothetical protein
MLSRRCLVLRDTKKLGSRTTLFGGMVLLSGMSSLCVPSRTENWMWCYPFLISCTLVRSLMVIWTVFADPIPKRASSR